MHTHIQNKGKGTHPAVRAHMQKIGKKGGRKGKGTLARHLAARAAAHARWNGIKKAALKKT